MRPIQFFLFLLILAAAAHADTFSGLGGVAEIEFVTIGDPGNPADTTGAPNPAGAVDYEYRIGKYEISEAVYYSVVGTGGPPIVGTDLPMTNIRWYFAAQFVNSLNQIKGYPSAYKGIGSRDGLQLWSSGDPGYDPANPYRNRQAFYFLPSADEWYKAAYYDPATGVYYDYATGSNDLPDGIDFAGDPDFETVRADNYSPAGPNDVTNAGLLSPYGTMGQTGNVVEWEETAFDLTNDSAVEARGARGGAWFETDQWLDAGRRGQGAPNQAYDWVGFRVASRAPVPEPGAAAIGLWAAVALSAAARRGRVTA
ncbi:Formylglycine-generating sulfatase enzyme [Posidoniimonas polymericola]|uniref:Formylglycine-generating sulfatase enzyme n=1 Tax=Posidoniimonas polymericola TaxID=2528002 RepID=A0A5C5ZDU9_9BACT|nr:SUMF1/EgtB/PvdO family nonheme iron enzyme [Posidoniimonas polymericola]TWT85340.1 Formylglycine-generating sulfatase enzyme [Posidoniimonas polymericola]